MYYLLLKVSFFKFHHIRNLSKLRQVRVQKTKVGRKRLFSSYLKGLGEVKLFFTSR